MFKVTKLKKLRLKSKYHCDSFHYPENLPMISKVQFLSGTITPSTFFSIYFPEWLKEHLCYSSQCYTSFGIYYTVPNQDSSLYIHDHIRDGTYHFLWHKMTFYVESYLLRKPKIYGTEGIHWTTKTVRHGIYTIIHVIQFISTGMETWMLPKRQEHGLWRWFWELGWGDEQGLWPGAPRERVNTVKGKFSLFHRSCQSGLDYWSINFGYLPIAIEACSKSLPRSQNTFIRFQAKWTMQRKVSCKRLQRKSFSWEIESLKQWTLSFLNNQSYYCFWICALCIIYINNHIISLHCTWLTIIKCWSYCGYNKCRCLLKKVT